MRSREGPPDPRASHGGMGGAGGDSPTVARLWRRRPAWPATHTSTKELGDLRISSDTTLVSSKIIAAASIEGSLDRPGLGTGDGRQVLADHLTIGAQGLTGRAGIDTRWR